MLSDSKDGVLGTVFGTMHMHMRALIGCTEMLQMIGKGGPATNPRGARLQTRPGGRV